MNAATISAAKSGNIKVGDFTVHRLGYGAMRLTGPGIWGLPKDRSNAIRVLRRAVELGVNFIDTSDAYGPNTNEELIAEALHPYSSGLVIATKGGLTRPGPDIWERNGRPSHLKQACEASLQRLRVERIDLYQLHAIDPQVPLEESLGALARLQQEGRIRHIGVSNFTVRDLERAEKVVKIVSVQNRYNATDRTYDDVIAYCEQRGIAFIPWYPLAAGSHAQPGVLPEEIRTIMSQRNFTAPQASLAWLLARSHIVLPIPGTSSIAHLEENVAAADR
jgi:aryl-alcohol dehydrogenase-like predicted oxidoreductase